MNPNMSPNMNLNMNSNEKPPKKKQNHKPFIIISSILIVLILVFAFSGPNTPFYRFTFNSFFKNTGNTASTSQPNTNQKGGDVTGTVDMVDPGFMQQKPLGGTTTTKDDNGYSVSDYRTAVNKSAYAFYNRKIYVQYSNRKMMHASPENATAGHTVFSSCTTFATQVYYDAFGIDLPSDGCRLNDMSKLVWTKYKNINGHVMDKDEVRGLGKYVIYYDEGKHLENESPEKLISKLAPYLKKGDIYNYHRKTDDFCHTMIVTRVEEASESNNYVPVVHLIESNGADYNYETMEEAYESKQNGLIGSIRTTTMLDRLDPKNFDSIGIVRYITDDFTYIDYNHNKKTAKISDKKLSLSPSGVGRLRAQDIYIEKNASALSNSNIPASNMDGVGNSVVVFKITIVRNSNVDYKNLKVSEYIDKNATITGAECLENCSIVSSSNPHPISADGKSVSWTFDMNKDAGEKVVLSYTISVNGPVGGDIVSSGDVSGIRNATYVFHIGRQLTPTEKGKILSRYEQEKENGNKSMTEVVKKVYAATGANLNLSYLNNLNVFDVLENDPREVQINNNGVRTDATTRINNDAIKQVTLNNFYGLRVCPNNHGVGSNLHLDPTGGKDHVKGEYKKVFEGTIWNQLSSPTDEFNERAREIKLGQLQVGDVIYRYTEYDGTNMKNKIYLYLGKNLYCGSTKCEGFVTIENGQMVEIKGLEAGNLVKDIVYDYYIVMRPALARS